MATATHGFASLPSQAKSTVTVSLLLRWYFFHPAEDTRLSWPERTPISVLTGTNADTTIGQPAIRRLGAALGPTYRFLSTVMKRVHFNSLNPKPIQRRGSLPKPLHCITWT